MFNEASLDAPELPKTYGDQFYECRSLETLFERITAKPTDIVLFAGLEDDKSWIKF